MASTATPEASDIRRRGRQRLIGAVALVALLVVFVPMLLDSEPRPAREGPTLAIPPKDPARPLPMPAARTPDPATKVAGAGKVAPDATLANPAAAPSASAGGRSATPYTSGASTPSTAGPRSSASAPPSGATPATVTPTTPDSARAASPAPAGAPPTAATPSAPPPRSGFAVQVGAFRDEAKLKLARDKLAAARVPHYTERLDAKGGGLTRLRAGPFETRDQAEAALANLKRASLDGKVVPLP